MKSLLKTPEDKPREGLRVASQRRVIAALQRHHHLTVRALASELGLSVPTAAALLRELEARGLARQNGLERTSGGRAARLYSLVPESRAVVFLDASSEEALRGWVLDLLANPIAEGSLPLPRPCTHNDVARAAVSLTADLVERAGIDDSRILGTVISVPGVNVEDHGVVVHSTNRFIEGMPMSRLLQREMPGLLIVVNDANLAAVGAAVEADKADLVFVLLGDGLGMGIYLDHEVRTGGFGFSGEIGHIPLGDKSVACYCGQRGCLERVLSLRGMAELFAGKPPGTAEQKDVQTFVAAVERHDAKAIFVLERAQEALADLAIVIANFLDPDTIAVGTPAPPILPWLQKGLESAVHAQVLFSHLRPMVVTATPDLLRVLRTGAVELASRYHPARMPT